MNIIINSRKRVYAHNDQEYHWFTAAYIDNWGIPGLGFDGLVGYSPIAMAKNAVHDAVHAGVHQLVYCRIFFQSNPSFLGVVAYLCFGGIASGKRKKPETIL